MLNTAIARYLDGPEVMDLYLELLAVAKDSGKKSPTVMGEFISGKLRRWGIACEHKLVGDNQSTILSMIRGTGECEGVFLNGHDYLVPAKAQRSAYSRSLPIQFLGRPYDMDTKDSLAAILCAYRAVHRSGLELKGDLLFAFTSGNEIHSDGASSIVGRDTPKTCGTIIIGGQTNGNLEIAEKGILHLKITTKGKSAHCAAPNEGLNAVNTMLIMVEELTRYQINHKTHHLLGHPMLNIVSFRGGRYANVLPESCELIVDIRTVPGVEHHKILDDIRGILEKLTAQVEGFRAVVKVLRNFPPVESFPDDPAIKMAMRLLNSETDSAGTPHGTKASSNALIYFPCTGLPCMVYGPKKSISPIKADRSEIQIDLWHAASFYANMVERLLISEAV